MFNLSPVAPKLRIGIYRTSSIGDVVLATACLDLLKKAGWPFEAVWVGRGDSLDLIKAAWPEVRTIEIAGDSSLQAGKEVFRALKGVHILIDLQCNVRSKAMAAALRVSRRIASFSMDKRQVDRNRLILEARIRGRSKPAHDRVLKASRQQFESMVDCMRAALSHQVPSERQSDLSGIVAHPCLPLPHLKSDAPWNKELRFGCWLGVCVGAAHPTKRAPLQLFRTILADVQRSEQRPLPTGLVLFGDSEDRQLAIELLDRISWEGPVLNLAGKITLLETATALGQIQLLLSNDSGLGHIAEAVGTPTAILFGPTVEGFGFAPWREESAAFSARTGCRPCSKHGKVDCRFGDQKCFHDLDLSSIATFVNTTLAKRQQRTGES